MNRKASMSRSGTLALSRRVGEEVVVYERDGRVLLLLGVEELTRHDLYNPFSVMLRTVAPRWARRRAIKLQWVESGTSAQIELPEAEVSLEVVLDHADTGGKAALRFRAPSRLVVDRREILDMWDDGERVLARRL